MTLQEKAASLSRDEIATLLVSQQERIDTLQQQIDWFKRQLFGSKSERRVLADASARQLALGETMAKDAPSPPSVTIPSHSRRQRQHPIEDAAEGSPLRFDPSVPVHVIEVPNPEIASLPPESYDIVGEKVTERLAQQRGPYVVLRYVRKVAKLKKDGSFSCAPAPVSVFERSCADVSFIAGLMIDKLRFHLPLYRQHQRLTAAGVHLSRSTLTHLVQRAALLLKPVYESLLQSILASKLLLMDETAIKAGHRRTSKGSGKMKTGYFWPVYGDQDEIVFPFSPSRSRRVIDEVLGDFKGTLLTDGYEAYERFAARIGELVHARCWSHARRYFVKAEAVEPELSNTALDVIANLYVQEATIRERGWSGAKKLEARAQHCKPLVDQFFAWLAEAHHQHLLLPSNPFTRAAHYTLDREDGLRVFLDNADVPLDTNGLEREIRPIAIGRKNWCAGQSSVKGERKCHESLKPCMGPSGCRSHPAKVDHQPEPSDACCGGDSVREAFTGSLQAA
jgi:transposase